MGNLVDRYNKHECPICEKKMHKLHGHDLFRNGHDHGVFTLHCCYPCRRVIGKLLKILDKEELEEFRLTLELIEEIAKAKRMSDL